MAVNFNGSVGIRAGAYKSRLRRTRVKYNKTFKNKRDY